MATAEQTARMIEALAEIRRIAGGLIHGEKESAVVLGMCGTIAGQALTNNWTEPSLAESQASRGDR